MFDDAIDSKIKEISDKFHIDIESVGSPEELRELRTSLLGKKGVVTDLLKSLSSLDSIEAKKEYGRLINTLKSTCESAIEEKQASVEEIALMKKFDGEKIDITLPSRMPSVGGLHILTQVEEEIVRIFQSIGFVAVDGNEIEDDYHNFEALNIPSYHPARDSHDTLFVDDKYLLRTHTSGMQVRIMKETEPPIAALSPGKCVRHDAVDAKHSPVFHQIEGFLVDKHVTFNDLKGCLEYFCKKMFGDKTRIRLRPDYFPFVEPGADISASCIMCGGEGCKTCGYEGWIEILGCGMIHPKVFEHAGYNPGKYSGFAFGLGIERVAMIKYGVPDIRMFYENDVEFLSQW